MAATRELVAITLPYDINFEIMEKLGRLKKTTTPILTHTINDPMVAAQLAKYGCRGIYTDFLLIPSP